MTRARLYPPVFVAFFVGMLVVATGLGIESWPFSSYPMYSVPKSIDDVESVRIAFELDGGERVFWMPDFHYLARDLEKLVESSRGRPGFDATLQTAARLVLADLHASGDLEPPDRIQQVVVVHRRVRRDAAAGRFVADDRTLAAFPVDALR